MYNTHINIRICHAFDGNNNITLELDEVNKKRTLGSGKCALCTFHDVRAFALIKL